LSEAARHELVAHADLVASLLAEVDRVAAATSSDAHLVVTHGEPHPGNLIQTPDGLALVDWDTVALAVPERDLWMLAGDDALIADYERLTGLAVDRRALTAHRLMWSLTDLAAYTLQLRNEHQEGADSDRALAAVRSSSAANRRRRTGSSARRVLTEDVDPFARSARPQRADVHRFAGLGHAADETLVIGSVAQQHVVVAELEHSRLVQFERGHGRSAFELAGMVVAAGEAARVHAQEVIREQPSIGVGVAAFQRIPHHRFELEQRLKFHRTQASETSSSQSSLK
jgi:hypothetical protein